MNDKAEDGRVLSMPVAQTSASPSGGVSPGVRQVFVRDLEVRCLVGVHEHEHDSPQRVRINLDLTVLEGARPIEDKLANVVCYEDIVTQVRKIIGRRHVKLVETLAEDIAVVCLSAAAVKSVRVRVEKLDVFSDAASVGIEIERLNSKV